jgi:hypothetical protein
MQPRNKKDINGIIKQHWQSSGCSQVKNIKLPTVNALKILRMFASSTKRISQFIWQISQVILQMKLFSSLMIILMKDKEIAQKSQQCLKVIIRI